MKKYHKIETVFERDVNGSKKLIEGVYINETVKFLKDCTWQFTEKIDGTNIRVYWDGHRISFAGRDEKSQIPKHLMEYLTATFDNNATEELFEQAFGEKEVILFGEGYGPKIQKVGDLYRDDVSFILFDVMVNGLYLERPNVEGIARMFSIDIVPILFEGTIDDAVKRIKLVKEVGTKSTIGTAPIEGFVGRPKVEMFDRRGNRVIVKIKVRDFEI